MIRLGIVGTGTIVEKFLDAVKDEKRIEVRAIYSRSEEKALQFANRYAIAETYTSLEQMALCKTVDAVYIASPNSLHASQSILFMQHKKHVFCEKPLASNASEVKQMIDVAQRNKVVLMEAMKSTLSPGFAEIQKHISEVGTVRRYFASYCQYSSRYDQYKDGIVLNAFKPQLSNGAIMDIGVYTIYPMVVLFGKPNKISASGTLLSTGVDGQGVVNFEYDEMVATVLYSKIADSYLPSEIQGESGSIVADRIDFAREVTLNLKKEKAETIYSGKSENEYFFEIEEFANVVESDRLESETNSHRNSLITIEIIDEIRHQLGVVFPADAKN